MHKRIKSARLAQNMSQSKLATLLGVSRSAAGQWESVEGSFPSTKHLIQIAKILSVNFEWLATGKVENIKAIPQVINEPYFNAEEQEILSLIKQMPIGKKRALLTFISYE